MTNVFGSGAPTISSIDEADTGPLQLGHAHVVTVPCVVTHIRYYVATTTMAANTSGSLPYQVWREGEPDSIVSGSLTIPATVGWVTHELSPHLFIPADRGFAAAVSLPSGTQSYGSGFQVLPESNRLMNARGSTFAYSGTPLTPYTILDSWSSGTSYLIDVEVAVSEMVNLDPAMMAVDDVIQVRRTTNGVVNTLTPITDALTVNVTVTGGPLDGTDVDVWIPDTTNGLLSADMQLFKEVADPTVGSEWQSSDTAKWVYQGGGVYVCFSPGTTFPEGAKTSRADTPSLTTWTP